MQLICCPKNKKTKKSRIFNHNILAQLCVDGKDFRVAHKGERQDGYGVGRLKMNPNRSP